MRIPDGKLWTGLVILAAIALVSSAAVFGGIEWALASLGAMALTGMIGASIYIPIKVRNDLRQVGKSVVPKPISKKDKVLIMAHIDRFFELGREQSEEKSLKAAPISKRDMRLIMKHIDELFEPAKQESEEKQAEIAPISEEDKKLTMADIDGLFYKDQQSQQMFS